MTGISIIEIIVLSQPVHLRPGVPVIDITLVILETPGDYNEYVSFANPETFLDLSLDSSQAGNAVKTPHPYVVCPEHEIGLGEYLLVSFLWQPYTNYLGSSWIEF
jgi:hypothetical protein